MSHGTFEPGSLATVLLGQFLAVGMLVAVPLQSWLWLRVTNPCAAYAEAWTHALAVAGHVRGRVGRRS